MSNKTWGDYGDQGERPDATQTPTVGDYEDLILNALSDPEELSSADYDFIGDLAGKDADEPLSEKQVDWLEDIEGKIY